MKKLITVFLTLAMLAALAAVPSFAEGDSGFVMPGAIVDFTTKAGYDDFCEKAEMYDLVSLTTGEYTIHGTNGKVKWEFVEEDGVSFARFTPIEPLDASGRDAEGVRDPNEGDFRMTAEIEFNIADYDYISFCYRTSPKAHLSTNHIYVRDDTHSGEFEGTNGMWVSNGLKNKGEWALKTIQISKSFTAASGTFKSIRIPIAGRVDEYFDIQYIVVYNDKDLCTNFDLAAYHEAVKALEPDPTEAVTEEPTDIPVDQPTEEPTEEPKSDTQANNKSGSGCGGAVSGAAAFALIIAGVPAFLAKSRKKKEQ